MPFEIDGVMVHVLENPEAVARLAASALLEAAEAAREGRRRAAIALSGGSAPRRLYQLLAAEQCASAWWERLEVFFGDERAVPPGHPDSNYRMAREALLDKVPLPPSQVHRMPAEEKDLSRAAERYEQLIRGRVPASPQGFPVFDLIWLGMGDDGHTASLFPGTRALEERTRWVVANEVPQLQTRRLTLTFPVLRAARRVQFLVAGKAKAGMVRRIFESLQDKGARQADLLPAARVRPVHGVLEWLLDREAAGEDRSGSLFGRCL